MTRSAAQDSTAMQAQPKPFLTDHLFQRVAQFAAQEAGLVLPDNKRSMVSSRLKRYIRKSEYSSVSQFLDQVEHANNTIAQQNLLSALTTNVTSFFREPHHFEFLARNSLPELVRRAKHGHPIRIWSAGCSTGEEPYSIALSALTEFPEIADLDFRILATDLDRQALSKAKTGEFLKEDIFCTEPAVPLQYFQSGHPNPDTLCVAPVLRNLVAFRYLNLMDDWPMRGTFDAVFCRNVTIYLDEKTKSDLWPRFYEKLKSGGYLFLGHSERISSEHSDKFENCSVTTFRRRPKSTEGLPASTGECGK